MFLLLHPRYILFIIFTFLYCSECTNLLKMIFFEDDYVGFSCLSPGSPKPFSQPQGSWGSHIILAQARVLPRHSRNSSGKEQNLLFRASQGLPSHPGWINSLLTPGLFPARESQKFQHIKGNSKGFYLTWPELQIEIPPPNPGRGVLIQILIKISSSKSKQKCPHPNPDGNVSI